MNYMKHLAYFFCVMFVIMVMFGMIPDIAIDKSAQMKYVHDAAGKLICAIIFFAIYSVCWMFKKISGKHNGQDNEE